MKLFIAAACAWMFAGYATRESARSEEGTQDGSRAGQESRPAAKTDEGMKLGNFSVSLTVKDLAASRAFYEKLGFKMRGGDPKQNWVVLQNDTAIVGLFQGMFPKNMLTFNPGWDRNKATLPEFEDVRDLQRALAAKGIEFQTKADEKSTGPAFFQIVDPDGNPILFDQHVPKPKK